MGTTQLLLLSAMLQQTPYIAPDDLIKAPPTIKNKSDYCTIKRLPEYHNEIWPPRLNPNPHKIVKVGTLFYFYKDIKLD